MPKIKTAELTGAALDWAVAKCEGVAVKKYPASPSLFFGTGFAKHRPSTDWSQGGPIIDRAGIDVIRLGIKDWRGRIEGGNPVSGYGPTPLIAAMRCYVMSKFGGEVDVPKEISDEQRPSPRR